MAMKGHTSSMPLFDGAAERRLPQPIPLNSTVEPSDVVRLSDQHHAILSRLREGPATGPELATIAIRYSARLQEMKALHPWLKRAIGGGQWEYRLVDLAAGENP